MLSRRILRVKVMQAIYAYEMAKKAHQQGAEDKLDEMLEPEWSEQSKANPTETARNKEFALSIFLHNLEASPENLPQIPNQKIKEAVLDTLNFYRDQNRQTRLFYVKSLAQQIENIYNYYVAIFVLLEELAKKEKLNESPDSSRISRNVLLEALQKQALFKSEAVKVSDLWTKDPELMERTWELFKKIRLEQKLPDPASSSVGHLKSLLKILLLDTPLTQSLKVSDLTLEMGSIEAYKELSNDEIIQQVLDKLWMQFQKLPSLLQIETQEQNFNELKNNLLASAEELIQSRKKATRQEDKPILNPQKSLEVSNIQQERALKRELLQMLIYKSLTLWLEQLSLIFKNKGWDRMERSDTNLKLTDELFLDFLDSLNLRFSKDDKINLLLAKEEPKNYLQDYIEQLDLYWEEDKQLISLLIQKSLGKVLPNQPEGFTLLPKDQDFKEAKDFCTELFALTLDHSFQIEKLIGEKSEHWDLSRVAQLDKIIVQMALCEIQHFHSIPVKVSINEYLELAKQYSSPKSKEFINGLLDNISKEWKEKGLIKKSGRGLMDNR